MNWIFAFCLLVLWSCTSASKSVEEEEQIVFEVNADRLSDKSFDDFYDLKKVIKLETQDSAILGDVMKVIAVEDRLFISSWNHPAVLVFDREGKYLYKINRQGKGPGEYLTISDLMVTERPREVIVYDRAGALYFYDWDGNYLRTEKRDAYLNNIERLPGGGWLTNHALSQTSGFRDTLYVLRASDPEGNYVRGVSALPSLKVVLPVRMISPLYQGGGRFYGIPITENTIYEYKEKDTLFIPRYVFRIAGYPVPKVEELTLEDFMKPFIFDYFIFSGEYIGRNTLVLSAWCNHHQQGQMLTFIADKKNKRVEVMPAIMEDRKNELPVRRYFQQTGFGEDIVLYLNPVELAGRTFSDTSSQGYRLYRELKEEDNPVLLIYQEK